jgi:hypothetical protein
MEEGKEKKTRVYNKKKQNKIVSKPIVKSIEDIEEKYLDNKKNEIPMYDPHTGDINPHYKELTGKDNPMDIPRRTNIYHNKKDVDKSSVNQSSIEQHEKNSKFKDYLNKNRFLINFPKELNIEPRDVIEVIPPKINIGYFGFTKYGDMTIKVMVPMEKGWISNFSDKSKSKLDIDIEFLNPLNIVAENYTYVKCNISNHQFLKLSYCSDNMVEMILTIKVGKIKYQ